MAVPDASSLPSIIQGGMGVAVSAWPLARAVAATGQLGVVSGTALDAVFARRLQDGDPGGHMREALAAFPVPEVAERIQRKYFRPEGRPPGTPYTLIPKLRVDQARHAQELAVVANFAEVWLAKQGHNGLVGVNLMEKIQMGVPTAAYGAMLAGVDVVLVGAGIPREVPRLLDALSRHEPVGYPVDVIGAVEGQRYTVNLDPVALLGKDLPPLQRPTFLAIVSAHVLVEYLSRDPGIRPDGFVIEGQPAGGHNAPPRGKVTLDDQGEPRYGPRDETDLARVARAGAPFWLAGGYGTPTRLEEALAAGATGVQVGTQFALSHESGLTQELRTQLLDAASDGTLRVRTSPVASPTGYPFKVAQLEGTIAEPEVYKARPRLCDLGHLRTPYVRPDGGLGYRCPAEPVEDYVRKGGDIADTVDKNCLCNGLIANIGLGQTRRSGYTEDPLVTLGSDLEAVQALLNLHPDGWSAAEVVTWLLGRATATEPDAAGAELELQPAASV